MDEATERAAVIAEARTWLRTPYRDCANIKGAGVDCAFFLKEVFERAGLEPTIAVDPYSPQWYLHRSEELYLAKIQERAREIAEAEVKPADVVVYKFGRCFAHGAIVMAEGWPQIIHAFKQAGIVTLGDGTLGHLANRERRFFTRKAWGTA